MGMMKKVQKKKRRKPQRKRNSFNSALGKKRTVIDITAREVMLKYMKMYMH